MLSCRLLSKTCNVSKYINNAKFLSSNSPFDNELGKEQLSSLLQNATESKEEKRKRKPRHTEKKPGPPAQDLSNQSVILFPGQGMQFVGMGKKVLEVPAVKELYNDASHILNYDLLKLCLEGPQSVLDSTEYCQAATVVSSLAAVEMLHNDNPTAVENCSAVAGFSVGEITALIFSGAISFSEGIALVKIRGEAMKAASESVRSGMMSVFIGADHKLGLGLQVAEEWCRREHDIDQPVCRIANHLYCGGKVIGGNMEALDFIEQNKSDFKIRRTKRLPVSGAFHTPLMELAVEPFYEALKLMRLTAPRVPVYSNFDNQIYTNPRQIVRILPKQLTSAVKWESSMSSLYNLGNDDIYPLTYECGPGKSLTAILHKINGKAGKRCRYIEV